MGFTNKSAPIGESSIVEEPSETSKIDVSNKNDKPGEPPFSGYSEIYNKPFTADYFKLDYYKELDDKTDVHNIRDKVTKIENYVKAEIKARRMKDTISSYKSIVENFFNLTGDIEKNVKSLSRLAEYANLAYKKRELDDKYNKLITNMGLNYGIS